MRTPSGLVSAAAVIAGILVAGSVETGYSCAPAPPRDRQVAIADETALILWNSERKIEHFIRRGTFQTDADDFGFLVPTPTVPRLTEVDDEVFTTLSKLTEPRVIYRSRPKAQGGGCGCSAAPQSRIESMALPGAAVDPPRVVVHSEQRIAGQDAVVLSADDAESLAGWLAEHGYDMSPALTEWLRPYVALGWKITAFKFAKEAATDGAVNSQAVCLSFETDQPLYPYREPPADSETSGAGRPLTGNRLLRVFFIGDARVTGTIGKPGTPWPGVPVWSKPLAELQCDHILSSLKIGDEAPPAGWRLTEFEDHSFPRPGTDDVWFSRDEIQAELERHPIIHYVARPDGDEILYYALVGGAVWTLARKRRPLKPPVR